MDNLLTPRLRCLVPQESCVSYCARHYEPIVMQRVGKGVLTSRECWAVRIRGNCATSIVLWRRERSVYLYRPKIPTRQLVVTASRLLEQHLARGITHTYKQNEQV